jgi:cytochrome b
MMKAANTTYVWDIVIRLFHWSLVILFVTSYLTGEEETIIHVYSGYAIIGLLFIRIIWGFIGSQYARFSDFIYKPATTIKYLNSLKTENPEHYTGHNPAGGYMVIALLIMLLVTTFSGLKLYGTEGHGPLANNQFDTISLITAAKADDEYGEHDDESEEEEFWDNVHEFAVNATLFLVFIHILGIFVSSRMHNENLVKAMITGKKEI